MQIRAYLRASTNEQDANRAKVSLKSFVEGLNLRVAGFYIENVSGNVLNRPELLRLLDESYSGDVLLVESVDRLTRLNPDNWKTLVNSINEKGVRVVSMDLPTSHLTFGNFPNDEFMASILSAINNMLLEILAASAYKDYQDRERRQKQGIEKAKVEGKYLGKKPNLDNHNKILKLVGLGFSNKEITDTLKLSISTVKRVKKNHSGS